MQNLHHLIPSGYVKQFAIEHGPLMVYLPNFKMLDLSIANCKRLPEDISRTRSSAR